LDTSRGVLPPGCDPAPLVRHRYRASLEAAGVLTLRSQLARLVAWRGGSLCESAEAEFDDVVRGTVVGVRRLTMAKHEFLTGR